MEDFEIPKQFFNSTFLLDTNFFIDSYSQTEDFKNLISKIKLANIELVSTSFVKFEFIRSKTIDVVRKKEEYFRSIIGSELLFDKHTESLVVGVIEEYKQYMERLPITDLLLAANLKRYKDSKLYLLTRDHIDFPTTVFERSWMFNIGSVRDIKTYALYCYKNEKKESKFDVDDEPPF